MSYRRLDAIRVTAQLFHETRKGWKTGSNRRASNRFAGGYGLGRTFAQDVGWRIWILPPGGEMAGSGGPRAVLGSQRVRLHWWRQTDLLALVSSWLLRAEGRLAVRW